MPNVNICRIVTGRLLEIDSSAGYHSTDDSDRMMTRVAEVCAQVAQPRRIVIAAEWRYCAVLAPHIAERAVTMMSVTNERLERSALLHAPKHPTSVMQLTRLAKATGFHDRRMFTDAEALQDWLGEVLDDAERARLKVFLRRA